MGLIIVLVSEIKHGQINVMTKSRQHFFLFQLSTKINEEIT